MITPHQEYKDLAEALGIKNPLFFKREDLHPLKSHKGRSIPYMIEKYFQSGARNYAISSSGNAGLAAAMFTQKWNEEHSSVEDKISLKIFVGKKINRSKLENLQQLQNEKIEIIISERPKQSLLNELGDGVTIGLRQSQDPLALYGYNSLATELLDIPDVSHIFIPTSSGTTAQGLAEAFKRLNKAVSTHIVQTSSCHPIALNFEPNFNQTSEVSIADAIVDNIGTRRKDLFPLLNESGGSGYIITNEEILIADEMVKKYTNLTLSPNSLLGIAGLMKAIYLGKKFKGSIVCIITGV
jgi:threonine dehydratase